MKKRKSMPNNPDNWFTLIKHMPPWLSGVLMAVVVAMLRVIYDKQETHLARVALEGVICGALTLAAGSAISAMGLSDQWHMFIGGLIGFMGVETVRKIAMKAIDKRIDK